MNTTTLRFFTMEFDTMGKQTKMLFFYPIIPFLYILYSKTFSFGIWMLLFIMPMLVVGPFMKEDNRQVDIFYATLPVNAKEVVGGRHADGTGLIYSLPVINSSDMFFRIFYFLQVWCKYGKKCYEYRNHNSWHGDCYVLYLFK